jgi:hypothetical protein
LDQISRQYLQSVSLVSRPAIFDYKVPAFNVAEPRRRPVSREASDSGDALAKYPTTGIAACCARATIDQPAAAPPSSVMNSRRFVR